MKFTLTKSEYNFIQKNVINQFASIGVEIYIFGSRSTNKHQKFSDLDLLIKDHPSKLDQIKKIKSETEEFLEESNFPYKVDIVLESEIAEGYRKDILSNIVLWK